MRQSRNLQKSKRQNNKKQNSKKNNKSQKGGNQANGNSLCLSSSNLDNGHQGKHGFHAKWDSQYCGKSGGGRKRNTLRKNKKQQKKNKSLNKKQNKKNNRKQQKNQRRNLKGGMSLLSELQPASDKVVTPKDVAHMGKPSQGVVGKEQCGVFHDDMSKRTFDAKQPFWDASAL